MNLTRCQDVALTRINRWLDGPDQMFVLGGYAGTGKTFLVKKITEGIDGSVQHCAYTGKAALALRERGTAGASTIHRLLYSHYDIEDVIEKYDAIERAAMENSSCPLWQKKFDQIKALYESRSSGFVINPDSSIRSTDILVVDEFSMLNEEVIGDLLSMANKILFLGDPAQMPPVEGTSPLKPDYFLDEVVRQALDNPVLRAATMVREGQELPERFDWGECKRIHRGDATWEIVSAVDQVLCGRNKSRHNFNARFRSKLGFHGTDPVEGDKLVCLHNDHSVELYNGTVGYCKRAERSFADDDLFIDFQQGGKMFESLKVWDFDDRQEIPKWARKEYQFFDYGYALTTHKAQGSEWDSICIFNEMMRVKGHLYTSLTRARKTAIIAG